MGLKVGKKVKGLKDVKRPVPTPEERVQGIFNFMEIVEEAQSKLGVQPSLPSERLAMRLKHLIDGYNGRASVLARAILYGLIEPNEEMDGNLYYNLSEALVEMLREVAADDAARLPLRVTRALAWAARDTTPHDFACYVGIAGMSLLDADQCEIVKEGDAYAAYYNRLKPVLDELAPEQ